MDFTYNSDIDTYEVHLRKGKNDQTDCSSTFSKEEGKILKIDFVNHRSNKNAKEEEKPLRRPRIIIDSFGG